MMKIINNIGDKTRFYFRNEEINFTNINYLSVLTIPQNCDRSSKNVTRDQEQNVRKREEDRAHAFSTLELRTSAH